MKTPTLKEITALLVALQPTIAEDFRATDDPDDNTPGMQVTIGADADGSWNYQTGDTQFIGGAYGFPYWGICYLTRTSNCQALAREALEEIKESQWEAQA